MFRKSSLKKVLQDNSDQQCAKYKYFEREKIILSRFIQNISIHNLCNIYRYLLTSFAFVYYILPVYFLRTFFTN